MAIIRVRNGIIHIQWYEPQKKKIRSKSLGLKVTQSNLKKARELAERLQTEITNDNKKRKMIGIVDDSIKVAFEHFLSVNQGKRPRTIEDYLRFYKAFTKKFSEDSPCSLIHKRSLEEWLMEIKRLPMKPNSIHGLAKQAVHFCNFLFEYNYIQVFKVNSSVMPKPVQVQKQIFSDDELKLIFGSMSNMKKNFVLLINLLFYTGLRSTDLLGIERSGVDLKAKTITFYSLKSKMYRTVPFRSELTPLLEDALQESTEGKLLHYANDKNLGKAVSRFLKTLNLKKSGISARTFRKTFITRCRNIFRMDAAIVRELVGHSHKTVMDKHYNEISIDDMRTELEKYKL